MMTISVFLDRSRPEPLTDQIVSHFKRAIGQGIILPGTRLPSSRRLAAQLSVSRNTVVRAYDQLILENFADARPASSIVARQPLLVSPPDRSTTADEPARVTVSMPKSPRLTSDQGQRLSFDFMPNRPGHTHFPMRAWRRHLQAALTGGAHDIARYGEPAGYFSLREAICAHLAARRGIVTEPGCILVVNGAQEALSLCAQVLVLPGRPVIVEDPSSQGAVYAFEAAGARINGIGVDESGLKTDELPDRDGSLLYIAPSHQYPTGFNLSLERRRRVVDWCAATGSYVVEDDCGADLRFDGEWRPAIASMAPASTVFVGSFSRVLGAGLRLGFIVVPQHLAGYFRARKTLMNNGTAWLEQAALARFMECGGYAAHLARLQSTYRLSRDVLIEELQRHFGEVDLGSCSGSLHMLWRLPPGLPVATTLEMLARRARVGVYGFSTAGVWASPSCPLTQRAVVMGFGALTPRQIVEGIARLSDVVDDRLDRHHEFLNELLSSDPVPARFKDAEKPNRRPAPPSRRELALHGMRVGRSRSPLRRFVREASRMLVTDLYRYPVKGLSPERITEVELAPDRPFPFDRVFALARANSNISWENPLWAKKALFLMLMLEERLALAHTRVDPDSLKMTIEIDGRSFVTAPLDTADGRTEAERLLGTLARPDDPLPKLVYSRSGHFMDKPDNVISLINLATIRDLEARWKVPIDPLRFRANVYIDGPEPWEEFSWIGSEITIGDATFRVDRRNGRCGATNVNPVSGERDRDIPGALRAAFGHKDLGVYLVTRSGGRVAAGDTIVSGATKPEMVKPTPPLLVQTSRRMICRGCYFIYDEAARPLPFASLPPNWECPDCGTDKSKFVAQQTADD